MKLTESANICYVSDRVACIIKVNIKGTLIGNDPFLQLLGMDCSKRMKDVLLDKFSIW